MKQKEGYLQAQGQLPIVINTDAGDALADVLTVIDDGEGNLIASWQPPAAHNHAASEITSGTIANDRLPATALTDDIPKSLIDAAGDIIYGSADNTPARLAKGTDGHVLTLVSGLPSWAAPSEGEGGAEYIYMTLHLSGITIGYNIPWVRYGNNNSYDSDAALHRMYVPVACTLKKAYGNINSSTNNKFKVAFSIAKNGDSSNELIEEVFFNSTKLCTITNASMSLSFAEGDYLNLKMETISNGGATSNITGNLSIGLLFEVS